MKVCGIAGVVEARAAIAAGAAAIGLVSHMPSGPGVIAEERIAEVAAAVRGEVATFLLTSLVAVDAVVAQHLARFLAAVAAADGRTAAAEAAPG